MSSSIKLDKDDEEDVQLTPVLRLGAGACARIIAMSATYPMDMVRGRLTVHVFYRVIFHALSTVLREEGLCALYRGWLPSAIGVVPYVGLNFAVYESLKDWLIKSKPFGLVEDSELGQTVASVVTGDGKSKVPIEYTGMVDAFRKTIWYEGFGALYKGLVVPSIAIAFVTYELVKDVLGVELRISD
ncbi:hypothetical protein GQ457_08G032290 [Hibiscus cannabinus]